MTMNNDPQLIMNNGQVYEPDSVIPEDRYIIVIDSQSKEYIPWRRVQAVTDTLASGVDDA